MKLSFSGKWMDLKNINPGSESQRQHAFSHMRNVDLIQIQTYYEKQVILTGGHLQEREGKRRKLRR
jgi:hypothetical protein